MFLPVLDAATSYTNFANLGLNPVAIPLGPIQIKWYSLAYIAGIFGAYWYLLKMLKQPGAPMARRHADDLLFYGMLGVTFFGLLLTPVFYVVIRNLTKKKATAEAPDAEPPQPGELRRDGRLECDRIMPGGYAGRLWSCRGGRRSTRRGGLHAAHLRPPRVERAAGVAVLHAPAARATHSPSQRRRR